jgi:hypothetical protein
MACKARAVLAAAAILVLSATLPVVAAPQAGEVLAFVGQCFLQSGGQRTLLKLGDAVGVGDTVEIAEGARLKLRMKDGSVVSAGSGTRVTIEAYDSDAQHRDAKLSLAAGLLRAVVSTVSQPSRFEVDTATGVAAVRSTDWFIEARQGSTQVGVLTGTVNLTSRGTKKGVNIPERWGSRIEAGMSPVPARVWSTAEFDDVIGRTDVK